ncbi:ubiquinone biosynthesis protein mitochondrial precursor [Grosmannia clavigera kw1407]|uniref:Ubiquinone biosynthesis protein n=1 Tax=Grosmannia clavigera (strain kw1407 / UAMH 11150) TaxID=655863 RepID=F0XNH1_GROCL|nr:ubiquinone biosynthesis protein mitochondrial precursor [Grosmannia clavigera kw1407]EFX00927.1 ubiquinone biosynthesis protein mitochondrial precursor [Grosmannia clavigera kw1407]
MPPVARSLAVLPRPQLAAARRLITTTSFSAAARPAQPASPQQQQPQQQCRHRHPIVSFGLLQHVPAAAHAPTRLRRRAYHSLDRPEEPSPQDRFSSEEQAILSAAYCHVPEHGFSDQTLALGARDAGYPYISTAILPDGVFSLVRWHLVSQRVALASRSQAVFHQDAANSPQSGPLSPTDIAARAERITWERLMGNKAVLGRWQEVCPLVFFSPPSILSADSVIQALAIMAQPSFVPASLRELARLVDEIWALAGDTSADPSWYSKRASLSAIYASSELFMTTDPDPEFAATRDFLHRRFQEAHDVGGYLNAVGQWAGFAASASVNVLRSKGVPI